MKQLFAFDLARLRLPVVIIMLAAFAVIGSHKLGIGLAATYTNHDAYGYADSCALVNNQTVIYGWANDPDAPGGPNPNVNLTVGSHSVTLQTSVAGYRDAAINAYIDQHYAGQPHPGTYGFAFAFGGLYKGNSYVVSGTALNYGSVGANTALHINTTHYVDNDSSKPYFSGGKVPDVCLATSPISSPAPPPPSSPQSGGSSSKSSTKTSASSSAPTASAAADATVKAGTTVAVVTVPADGASKVHLNYHAGDLAAINTDDQTVSAASTIFTLKQLQDSSTYSFVIVRTTASGANATSAAATFVTGGYSIRLHFEHADKKPVAGIATYLTDKTKIQKSDENGLVSFNDIPGGLFTPTYTYNGQTYSSAIDTSTHDSGNEPSLIVIEDTVNVDSLHNVQGKVGSGDGKNSSNGHKALLVAGVTVPALFITIVGGWLIYQRWRRKRLLSQYERLSSTPDAIDRHSHHAFSHKQDPPEPLPEHMGKSLRDMVIEGLREEAKKGRSGPPPPHVPGR